MPFYTTVASRPPVLVRRPTINELFLSSYSLAIYSGCEFGCPYCDGWNDQLRPFNETIRAPLDLPAQLAPELAQVGTGELIAITAQTDAYQPAERTYRVTRNVLQIFAERGQPTLILTKSALILEDLDLLQTIQQRSLAVVMFTLLTTDQRLADRLEGRAAPVADRLRAITALRNAGITVGVALIPAIPYVTDTDYTVNPLTSAVQDAGAQFLVWDTLRIPTERHRVQISEMLQRVGGMPPSYYRELYGNEVLPNAVYRAELNARVLARCDALNLPTRAPHALYAGRLSPANEAALLLRHTAHRDAAQGRSTMAEQARSLADRVYRKDVTEAELRTSPLYPQLRTILGREA